MKEGYGHAGDESIGIFTQEGGDSGGDDIIPAGQLPGSDASDIHCPKFLGTTNSGSEMSYDEEIYDPNAHLRADSDDLDFGNHNGSSSDRVGQMQRGFTDLLDESKDSSEEESLSAPNTKKEVRKRGAGRRWRHLHMGI